MIALITQLLILGGCTPNVVDSGQVHAPYTQLISWEDDRPGTAFGSGLAADGAGVWVGSPEDAYGRIDRIESGIRRTVLEPTSENGLGFALAWSPQLGLLAGAPLSQEGAGHLLREDGEPIFSGGAGDGLGSAILETQEGLWVAGNDKLIGDEMEIVVPGRARALVDFESTTVAGLVQSLGGLWTEDGTLPTSVAGSLAGASLCVADVDEDGRDELVVGAPGANQVHIISTLSAIDSLEDEAETYSGSGHFGWALACGPGNIWVGAPLYGQAQSGAVFRIRPGSTASQMGDPWFAGEHPGEQMGFALSQSAKELWIGSPGNEDSHGRVFCAY